MSHELITMLIPCAGAAVGSMHVPDLMYADDVALLAFAAASAQSLAQLHSPACLRLFCDILVLKINIAPVLVCCQGARYTTA